MSCSGNCGKGINSGFPFDAVNEIMLIASMDIPIEALKLETSVFKESCYEQIMDAVKEIFTNHFLTHKVNVVSVVAHFIDENSDTSSSSSDSEDDINFCKYHLNIGYSSGDDNTLRELIFARINFREFREFWTIS